MDEEKKEPEKESEPEWAKNLKNSLDRLTEALTAKPQEQEQPQEIPVPQPQPPKPEEQPEQEEQPKRRSLWQRLW